MTSQPWTNKVVPVVALGFTMALVAMPAESATKNRHPIKSFFVSFIIRHTVGKPKAASPNEKKMQQLLNASDKYVAVEQRAESIGFTAVTGQMRIVRIPVTSRVLWVFPILRGYKPYKFVLQPLTNEGQSAVKAIFVANQENAVIGAAILDPDVFTSPSGEKGTPAYRRAFVDCAKDHFKDCGLPCAEELITKSPILAAGFAAPPLLPHAAGAYVVAVLNNPKCGGCAINALVNTIIDYGMAAIPAPAAPVEQTEEPASKN